MRVPGGVPMSGVSRVSLKAPLPSNMVVKVFCLTYLMSSVMMALTGRGLFGLLQGVVGIIVSVEGFYGAENYDRKTLRRFIVFLCMSTLFSVAMGSILITTNEEYCKTAPEIEKDSCFDSSEYYVVAYMGLHVMWTIIMAFVTFLFKRAVVHSGAPEQGDLILFQDDLVGIANDFEHVMNANSIPRRPSSFAPR